MPPCRLFGSQCSFLARLTFGVRFRAVVELPHDLVRLRVGLRAVFREFVADRLRVVVEPFALGRHVAVGFEKVVKVCMWEVPVAKFF